MKTRFIAALLITITLIMTLASCDTLPNIGGADNGGADNGGDVVSLFEVDIESYKNSADESVRDVFANINSVKIKNETDYGIEVNSRGFKDFTIKVTIGADGKIVNAETVSNNETMGDDLMKDGGYNAIFINKTKAECAEVDLVAGCTMTTSGYKKAVLTAFSAYEIINGVNQED